MEKEQRELFEMMDTVNGTKGQCIAKINGKDYDLIYLISINTRIETLLDSYKMTGEMCVYYGSASVLTNIYLNDINAKNRTYFDLVIINDDIKSNMSKQEIILRDAYITGIEIAKLDVNCTALTQNIKFAFRNVEVTSNFKKRALKRAKDDEIDKNDLEYLRKFTDESIVKEMEEAKATEVARTIIQEIKKILVN